MMFSASSTPLCLDQAIRSIHIYEGESFSLTGSETVIVKVYSRNTIETRTMTVHFAPDYRIYETYRATKELRLERTKVGRARASFRDCERHPETRLAPIHNTQGMRRMSQPSKCR